MNQDDFIEILKKQFLKQNRANYRILVDGPWGIGKTYAWKIFKHDYADQKKFIYISLFGMNTINNLVKELKIEYLKLWAESKVEEHVKSESKLNEFKNLFKNNFVKNQAAIQTVDSFSKDFIGQSFELLSFLPLEFNNEYIVCFDDLERKSPDIDMKNLLGIIERIGLNSNILIITNTKQLVDEDKRKLDEFKEKVIDREYRLDSISSSLLSQCVQENLDKSLEIYQDNLINFFAEYCQNNIRVLFKSIDLLNDIDKEIDLNNEIVKLCCAIINEDSLGNSFNLEKELKNSSLYKGSIYMRYKLGAGIEQISLELYHFLRTGEIDKNKINLYLHPEIDKSAQILHNFEYAILYNEDQIKQWIYELLSEIDNRNYNYFVSHERLLMLIAYITKYTDKFKFNIDHETYDKKYSEVFKYLVSKVDHSSTRLNKVALNLNNMDKYVTDLLTEFNIIIDNYATEQDIKLFNQYFIENNFVECDKIIKSNFKIVSYVLYIFDRLLEPQIAFSFYEYIANWVNMLLMQEELKDIVINKLTSLKDSSEDSIIIERINMLLNQEQSLRLKG